MKAIYKILVLIAAASLTFSSCNENDGIRVADTAVANPATYAANFLLINASADGPSLDFFANGLKVGASVDLASGQNGYTNLSITTPGLNSIANTSLRARATSGSIGGTLGSNDILYRATNTGIGNFVAIPNTRYTFIAVDSISRPVPLRTFSINTITQALAADLTYYNRANGQQISLGQFKALTPSQQANCVSIGVVPAGNSDPGGIRFYALTDTYPTDATIATAVTGNQSFIRFVHASPNASAVWLRLTPSTGAPIVVVSGVQNVMSVVGGFTPSVGSRTTAVGFTTTATGASTKTYTLEVSTASTFTPIVLSVPNMAFTPGKIYTIVVRGILGKTGSKGLSAAIVQHN